MATQIERKGNEIQIRSHIAGNGPIISIPNNEKGLFIASLQGVNSPGPPAIAVGSFIRGEDETSNPIAVFIDEDDAEAFAQSKGAGFSTHVQGIAVDGFAWVVTQD